MPLQRCKVRGKLGWKWGDRGKCYVGEGAVARALEQARAIKASQRVANATRRPPNPLRRDPTRTLMLRKTFSAAFSKRFRQLKGRILELIVKEDALGLKQANRVEAAVPKLGSPFPGGPTTTLNIRWRFRTQAQKIAEFERWLADELHVITGPGMSADAYWADFIERGYRQGAGRAFEDTRRWKWGAGEGEFYAGTKKQFLLDSFAFPIAKEKVELVAGRVFTDLKGITQDMGTRMTRVLTEGLVQGMNPREVARRLNKQVEIGRKRAFRIAQTETIRAHAEGQLDALEMLGVEELGVAVEWSTSGLGVTELGNPSPCEVCAPLQGIVMKLEEARGLLPRHPNCRCSYIPANVGESTKEQKRTRAEIRKAIDRSIRKEVGGKRTLEEKRAKTRWGGADTKIGRKRPQPLVGLKK